MFLFSLFFYSHAFCQQPPLMISLGPIILPENIFGVQPGGQYQLSQHVALLAELGIPIKNSDRTFEKKRMFRISSELKWFRPELRRNDTYCALQLSYTYRKLVDRDTGVYLSKHYSEDGYRYSSAKITSPAFSALLKAGAELRLGEKWRLDLFLGGGVRSFNTSYNAKDVKPTVIPRPRDIMLPLPESALRCDCVTVRPQLASGIRIMRKI